MTTLLLILALVSGHAKAQDSSLVPEVAPFNSIEVGGIFKVELIQGENHFVEIKADEQVLSNVEVKVRNGVLRLSFSGSTRRSNITATIMTPDIERINLSGASSLTASTSIHSPGLEVILSGATSATLDVQTESLKSRVSGASNLTLSGSAEKHNVSASGASQVRAEELVTVNTLARLSGASNARVEASNTIDINASGTSRVIFQNEPENLQIKTSGMANVNGTQTHMVRTSESGDTTRISIGSRDLWIIEDEGNEKVRIERRSRGFRNNWSGFELGINGYLTPNNDLNFTGDAELIDLRYEKSVIVNLNLFQQSFPLIRNNLGLVTGFGVSWNNYRFDNQTRIQHTREGLNIFEIEDPIRKNKLTLTYITVPLMLEYQTSSRKQLERFHLAGGMILGTRIGTHTKTVFDEDGKKRKEKDYSNFHVPPFRFDVTGRIGWGRVNLFATYALNSLFKEDKGPELYPFSVGIRLVNF